MGESGLIKQLSQRLIERALIGELNHHLKSENPDLEGVITTGPAGTVRRNSWNGYSKKTVQSEQGAFKFLERVLEKERVEWSCDVFSAVLSPLKLVF